MGAIAVTLAVLSPIACGDEEPLTGPLIPRGEWVKIATFSCPADAQTSDDCTERVAEDTLTTGNVHIQELVFTNAEYLFGILSWPLDGASSCPGTNSAGRCVLFDVWGPFNLDFGLQRIAFRLADPIDYRIEFFLMVGGTVVADTVFDIGTSTAVSSATVATEFSEM